MNQNILNHFDIWISDLNKKIKEDKKNNIKNNDTFRVKALKNAKLIISTLDFEITHTDQLKNINGIGEGINKRISEILLSTPLTQNEYNIETDKEFFKLQTVIEIGEVKAKKLLEKNITLDVLLNAWKQQDETILSNLTHAQILGLKHYNDVQERIPRNEINQFNDILQNVIQSIDNQLIATICGSYRRGKQDSGDIDVLLTHSSWLEHNDIGHYLPNIINIFKNMNLLIDDLTTDGKEKYMGFIKISSVVRRIDIICLPKPNYIAGILYFTGSKEENIRLRRLAIKKGYKLNQNGLYQDQNIVFLNTEKELYDLLGARYKEPTER